MRLCAPLVRRYLTRLGLPHAPPPNMAGLSSLLKAHVARIPYGNLDTHTGKPVSQLAPFDAAAERLLEGRGGYCFHLAFPFAALLNALGFDAGIYRGQVINHPGSPPEPAEPNHAVVLVSNVPDAPTPKVMADVGIGDGFRHAVPLRSGVVHEPPFAYELEHLGGTRWRFLHDATRGGFKHFDVDAGERATVEAFVEPHRLLSTLPESIFVQTLMVMRVDEGLIEKIVNRRFRRMTAAGTTETLIETEAKLGELLRDTFELSVSDAERSAIWRSLLSREEVRRAEAT